MTELNRAHKHLTQRVRLICPPSPLRDAIYAYAQLDNWELESNHPMEGLVGGQSSAEKMEATLGTIEYADKLMRYLDTVEAQAVRYFGRRA